MTKKKETAEASQIKKDNRAILVAEKKIKKRKAETLAGQLCCRDRVRMRGVCACVCEQHQECRGTDSCVQNRPKKVELAAICCLACSIKKELSRL